MLSEHETRPTLSDPAPLPPEAPDRPQPIHPDILLRAAIFLGVGMILLALVWAGIVRQGDLGALLHPADLAWLVPGLAIGAGFAWLVWRAAQHLDGSRKIVRLLEETIDLKAMRFQHVLWFSLLAAFPEEILFRGAIQVELGVLFAALIFGGLHALTRLYFVYATTAGLLLGALFALSGTLWTPIGAHFAIDLITFLLLLQRQNHHIG
jgi:membrane protease YdiL (CAAX protease family)